MTLPPMTTSYNRRSALPTSPSPLRHASTASSNSSAYSANSADSFNAAKNAFTAAHKRHQSEYATPVKTTLPIHDSKPNATPASTYQNIRQSLKPLAQAPIRTPPAQTAKPVAQHARSQSVDSPPRVLPSPVMPAPLKPARPLSMALSRSDSVRRTEGEKVGRPGTNQVHFSPTLDKPEIQDFGKSSTSQLRTLSKFAGGANKDDFSIKSPEQEVTGLHGRRRLQRGDSVRVKNANSQWAGRTWIDQQRQFLQAYEYLCHIGEAKEWIEDVMQTQIPPIIELEEKLRDGVTLAELVQSLYPQRSIRIFRHDKLQYRHSDNVAVFFRFLEEVELPDLFWFELIDLYEKKNIPKVIYCIHALSWLLYRKGITDFRIGNLVGQLQFEDHELEAMQKGLDKAGVTLPNFSGMGANFGAEPEPEPVETEDERIDRELRENEAAVTDLQAQIRGALARMRLGDTMQELWDTESWLVNLQAKIRGDFAREVAEYRLGRERFAINIQAAARGYLARRSIQNEQDYWQDREQHVVALQSLIRSRQARAKTQQLKSRVQRHEGGIRGFQAAVRGALLRRDISDDLDYAYKSEPVICDLQSIIRGALARKNVASQLEGATAAEHHVERVQAAIRGLIARRAQKADHTHLRQHERTVTSFQTAIRAAMARREHVQVKSAMHEAAPVWEKLQASIRAGEVRRHMAEIKNDLAKTSTTVTALQAAQRASKQRSKYANIQQELAQCQDTTTQMQARIRGQLLRNRHRSQMKALHAKNDSVIELQCLVRGCLQRQRVYDQLCEMNDHEEEIIALQSLTRGLLCRSNIGRDLMQLEEEEDHLVEFQALVRRKIVEVQFAEKKKFFKENMEKVIKIQSFVRAKQQGEAYKTLIGGKNPPVGIVKNFVHLLNDSDFDFDEEIEFERLRKQVIQQIRQNEMTEEYVGQIDLKIALLVKNKIDLDEVIRQQRHFGGSLHTMMNDKKSRNDSDLKALNKNSKKKLEHYQELFFLLQTQPQYLARLARRVREQSMNEQESKKTELLFMGMFGFAQKRREEYYLIKMMARCIKEEADACTSIQDYMRSTFFWNKILQHRIRSPQDRKYLRELLAPVVREDILGNEGLDLESDPLQIYRSAINNEELRTGQRSRRPADITQTEAIQDPETRHTFITRLQVLRDIADHFLLCLENTVRQQLMPYGMRYIGQQMFAILQGKFPHEEPRFLLLAVGHWLWKTYMLPALLAPDTWGVVDRGLTPLQKRNLGEVAKVIGQITSGRLFGGENLYLQPINAYITEVLPRFEDILLRLVDIKPPEIVYEIDEFNDLYARTKPTLIIKLADIFTIHNMITQDLPTVCPNQDDVLREVIRELGSARNNEHEMLHVSSAEISLQLSPKYHDMEDPDAAVKSLFMETKRCVLYIIRIQTGSNLLEIMVRPITSTEETKWSTLVRDELAAERTANTAHPSPLNPYAQSSSLLNITTLTYSELKRTALENILTLEQTGRITRANHYQDILNAIALDIRTKHNRRQERSTEMATVRQTLQALDDKRAWLDSQLASYNNYIEQAMITLQQKSKGKKRFLLPFTRQWDHERELERSGRRPAFGSFKYSARKLQQKGVLMDWSAHNDSLDRIDITIESDEVGVFRIEASRGSTMVPGASASLGLEDLLEEQFNKSGSICLFGEGDGGGRGNGHQHVASVREGPLRLNVNLLVHLIMKKFYQEG